MFDVFSQSMGILDYYAAGLLANWIGFYENVMKISIFYYIELLSITIINQWLVSSTVINSGASRGGGGGSFFKAFHLSEPFFKYRKQLFHIYYIYIFVV